MKAQLILENGKKFTGTAFGDVKNSFGEVIFCTAMVGYQEILNNPENEGKIVVMTFPLIGNYGVNFEDVLPKNTKLSALVMREKCDYPSNFRMEMSLDDYLKQQGVVGIEGIDTRALIKNLRGVDKINGFIILGEPSDDEIKNYINNAPIKEVE